MERVARAPRRRVRLLLVLAALAGLFLMHGLSDHGMARPDTASTADHTAHAYVETADPDQRAPGAEPSSGAGGLVEDDLAGEHGGHGGGQLMMVGLCLALLVVVVSLLPLLRSVVVGRRIRVVTARSQAWPAPLVSRPPDLVALGVCRC